jgi:hypothetical protein
MFCHLIWIQADEYFENKKLIPKNIKKNYNKIINLNPDKNIVIKTWSNNDIRDFIKKEFEENLSLYDSIIDLRFKSDLARLFILYIYNGVYIDVDQECLLSLDDFGINNNTELCLIKSLENNRIANGFMYVKDKNNIFIKNCIDEYINMLNKSLDNSGCDAINNVLNRSNNENILLLTENFTKNEKDCSCITEFYLSFYMFNNNGDRIMRSRYPDYYSDKNITKIDELDEFI